MSKKRFVLKNLFVATATQLITLALGFILPRVILTRWGSEYNGLINSVTTVMRYLALLEAGINTSTLQALYKPIAEQDNYQTSVIVRSSQQYYRHMAVAYTGLVTLISFVYPLFLTTTISYWEIVVVILLQGCSGVINFVFRASYQQLLTAEGKYYIISLATLVTTILTYISKFIAIVVFDNIVVMQLLGVAIMGIQVIFYSIYFRKKYQWLQKKVEINMSLLENRKYYLIQQLAGLIFNSTDTLVLSIFCGLKVASVYTVYNMVYSALTTLISILRHSFNFVLGQAFYGKRERFAVVYRCYSALQITLGGILSSCSIVLITGFVTLYTAGVDDINYINYWAAILFSINIMLDCSRGASLAAANVAGQAPKTTWRYVVEAIANLSVSLLLVNSLGMNGVLIGTVVSGLWRSFDSIQYFHKKVLNDKAASELLFVVVNFTAFACFSVIGKCTTLSMNSYYDFIRWGIVIAIAVSLVFGAIFFFCCRKDLKMLVKTIPKNR